MKTATQIRKESLEYLLRLGYGIDAELVCKKNHNPDKILKRNIWIYYLYKQGFKYDKIAQITGLSFPVVCYSINHYSPPTLEHKREYTKAVNTINNAKCIVTMPEKQNDTPLEKLLEIFGNYKYTKALQKECPIYERSNKQETIV